MSNPTSPSTWLPSSSTNPTSLGSRSRRRELSGESAASNVDTTDPFRQGFPNPLRPHPQATFIVESKDAEKIRLWVGEAKKAIVKILETRGIVWETISLLNRRDPRAEADERDLTIVIGAQHDMTSDSWYLSLQDIFSYLQENNLSHIRVEMIDGKYSRAPGSFIVEPTHPLVPAWPGIRDRIVTTLGARPWLSLSAIRRGTHENPEENPVIILITTPCPADLRPLLSTIISICANAGFPLQVELFEESSLFCMESPINKRLDSSAFTGDIPMGSSVSPRSVQDASATMGGAILLSKNNLHVRVGVTNFHVFWSKDTPREFVDNGLSPRRSSKINVRAAVPSNQDTIFTLAKLREDLNTVGQDLVRAKERWDMLGEERSTRIVERLQANEHNILQNIKEFGSFNRDAGNLWACSGYRVHPQTKFGIDWALVRLPDHRATPNLLPSPSEINALGPDTPYAPPPSLKLEDWSSERVRSGERVYKRGRTTGLTCGRFNAIEPYVNLGGKVCSAWEVVGTVGREFCDKGDSGSFIIDSGGNWCALLFAAPTRSLVGLAYVLPVDGLIADIERITGGTVSLP